MIDGTVAVWLGVNLSGLEFGTHNAGGLPGRVNVDYLVPKNSTMDYWVSKGVRTFRLPFRADRIQPKLGALIDPTYLGYISGLIEHAGTVGAHVVIDMHNYTEGVWGGVTYFMGGLNNGIAYANWTVPQYTDLVRQIVQALHGKPGFGGFDLMNEPGTKLGAPNSFNTWPQYAQAAVDLIGPMAPHLPLYAGGHGGNAKHWVGDNPLYPLRDPNHQVVYSAHQYPDCKGSGTGTSWTREVAVCGLTTEQMVSSMTPFTTWLAQHSLKGHIGEIGAPGYDTPTDEPNWLASLSNAFAFLKPKGILTHVWGAGGYWSKGYTYSLDPRTGVDAPQTAVIIKYE